MTKIAALFLLAACGAHGFRGAALPTRAARTLAPARLAVPSRVPARARMLDPSPLADGTSGESALTALVLGYALVGAGQGAAGVASAWLVGTVVSSAFGTAGWVLCFLNLLACDTVTRVRMGHKEALGIAEGKGGPERVLGSVGAAALCALGSIVLPAHASLLLLGYVASLAAKLSETFASELGKAYGSNAFLITSMRPVPKGTKGAVSLEGTLAGVGGSLVIALSAYVLGLCSLQGVAICLIAAFLATTVESLIGATVQGEVDWLTDEVVSFTMTCIGAATAVALKANMMG